MPKPRASFETCQSLVWTSEWINETRQSTLPQLKKLLCLHMLRLVYVRLPTPTAAAVVVNVEVVVLVVVVVIEVVLVVIGSYAHV